MNLYAQQTRLSAERSCSKEVHPPVTADLCWKLLWDRPFRDFPR